MSTPNAPHAASSATALRAEYDESAGQLEARASVDELQNGLLRLFLGLISTGLAVKLAWDRWGVLKPGVVRITQHGPAVFLWLAMGVAVTLLAYALRALLRARRLGRAEDR